jgi:hypothetical protein
VRIIPLHCLRWLSVRADVEHIQAASAVSPCRRLRPDRDRGGGSGRDRGPSRWPPLPRTLHPCGFLGPLTPTTRCCHAPDAFPHWTLRYCLRCDRSSVDDHPEVAAAQAHVRALMRARREALRSNRPDLTGGRGSAHANGRASRAPAVAKVGRGSRPGGLPSCRNLSLGELTLPRSSIPFAPG